MKAIEINTRTNEAGYLKINYPLYRKDSSVRVLILVDDKIDSVDEEKLWRSSISANPAFDFLNNVDEDIYSLADGEPFND